MNIYLSEKLLNIHKLGKGTPGPAKIRTRTCFQLNYKGNLSFYTGFQNSSAITVLLRKLLKGTETWNTCTGKGLVSKC